MNNNGHLISMHSFWLAQRNVAKLQESLNSSPDMRSRSFMEALLKHEERKLGELNSQLPT
jgi:hypothetical protein